MPQFRAVSQNPTVRIHPVVATTGNINVRIVFETDSNGDGWICTRGTSGGSQQLRWLHRQMAIQESTAGGLTARGLLGTKVQGFESSKVVLEQIAPWLKCSSIQQCGNHPLAGSILAGAMCGFCEWIAQAGRSPAAFGYLCH